MKISALIAAILFIAMPASASVLVSELMYSPGEGPDAALEWVELHNAGSETINISAYKISGHDFDDTVILPGEYLIVARTLLGAAFGGLDSFEAFYGNSDGVWDADDGDYRAVDGYFTLSDSGGYVNLSDGAAIVDSVYFNSSMGGYGNNKTLERQADRSLAESLAVHGTPGMGSLAIINDSGSILIYVNITLRNAIVNRISITPDFSGEPGIQIVPLPGNERQFSLVARIEDDNLPRNLIAELAGAHARLTRQANSSGTFYLGNLSMLFSEAPGIYAIVIKENGTALGGNSTLQIEFMPLVAYEIDADSVTFSDVTFSGWNYVLGDKSTGTPEKPTLRNIGNTVIDAELSGSEFTAESSSIPAGSLWVRLSNLAYTSVAKEPLLLSDLDLQPGESTNLDLGLQLPASTPGGFYQGGLRLIGVESQ